MNSRDVKSVEDARVIVEERGLKHIKVGVFDMEGVLRGKYMSREKFYAALEGGFGFCDVILGWDSNDQLYDNVSYTGWHTGYPDALARVLPGSCRELPFEERGLFFLCEFDGQAEAICPRGVLRRVVDKARTMGYEPHSAFEYEFSVFNETRDSVRDKKYHALQPVAPGLFGYSVLRNTVDSEIYRDLLTLSERMDFELEGLHEETGPGAWEAAIAVDKALSSADKAALFKTFSKVALQRQGLIATFMAKWSPDYPGQGGHIHLSLWNEVGKSVFFDKTKAHNMSDVMRYFVGGQQRLMPELLAMVAPTINAYTRLVPGFWAPTDANWSVENRTCALRVIPGSEKSQRVEYRIAAADANPYIVLSAALASGLWGIENKIEPEASVQGNAYEHKSPKHLSLPTSLWEAAQRLKQSSIARELFGDAFVEHFSASREWEEREFRKHITDWELARYFEII